MLLNHCLAFKVEMAGVEPASRELSPGWFTSLVGSLISPETSRADQGVSGQPNAVLDGPIRHQAIAPRNLSRPSLALRGEAREDVAAQLSGHGNGSVVGTFFKEPPFYEVGAPRLAIQDHRFPVEPTASPQAN